MPAPNTTSEAVTASATMPVRVRLKNGGQVRLLRISVVGDSLIGSHRDGTRAAIPVVAIEDLVVEKTDAAATLIGLILLAAGVFIVGLLLGGPIGGGV